MSFNLYKTKFKVLSLSTAALVLSATFSTNALAGSVSRNIAKAAKGCATSSLCQANPTGRAFGKAVKSMDRLGWEIGRSISIKKYGTDPGKYQGIKR